MGKYISSSINKALLSIPTGNLTTNKILFLLATVSLATVPLETGFAAFLWFI